MKFNFDPEADALMVYLAEGQFNDSIEVALGVQVDVDMQGQPLRVEVLDVRSRMQNVEVDLSSLVKRASVAA